MIGLLFSSTARCWICETAHVSFRFSWFWIILIKLIFFSDLEIGKFLKKATMATTRMNKKGYLSLTSPRSLMKFLVDEGAFWRNFLQSRFVTYTQYPIIRNGLIRNSAEFLGKFKKQALGRSNLRNASKNLRNGQCSDFQS